MLIVDRGWTGKAGNTMHELSEKEKAEAAKIWRDSYYSCYKGKDMYATENPCDTCTASQCLGREEAGIKTMQEQKYAKTIGEYLQYVIDTSPSDQTQWNILELVEAAGRYIAKINTERGKVKRVEISQ